MIKKGWYKICESCNKKFLKNGRKDKLCPVCWLNRIGARGHKNKNYLSLLKSKILFSKTLPFNKNLSKIGGNLLKSKK